ncbi:DNA polymerase eta [Camellia lanceoleosa]|uniref:DNA polymerase eta n=1 Tax=Camellia lanceoleosa TaxID=1840588 RepID=A0ACC0H9H4_9ERIC|nr:DNA polymerase eta [Camellia lanceoleosa]
MSSVIKKFFIASMFMWVAPIAILYGFNHNLFLGASMLRIRCIVGCISAAWAAAAALDVDLCGRKNRLLCCLWICYAASECFGSTQLSSHSIMLLSGFLAVISMNVVIAFYICMVMKEPSDKHEPDPKFLTNAKASLRQNRPNEDEDSSQTRKKEDYLILGTTSLKGQLSSSLDFVPKHQVIIQIGHRKAEDGSDHKDNVREWLHRSDADHHDKLLACGALIVAELRMQVLKETEFTCSTGITHNKMLAKLVSGMNKPAQQTVVPFMKQLGGKLGSSLQIDLDAYLDVTSDSIFFLKFRTWLWNIAKGISEEEVEGRLLPKSHGSGKTFLSPRALKKIASFRLGIDARCGFLTILSSLSKLN